MKVVPIPITTHIVQGNFCISVKDICRRKIVKYWLSMRK